jgi:hypothetical protein
MAGIGCCFDGLFKFVGGLFGGVNVPDGEEMVDGMYHSTPPSWEQAKIRTRLPSLKEVANGYDAGVPAPPADAPANFRGNVLSGTKRTWTAR